MQEIDLTSPHYKGQFASIYEVNKKFPGGGAKGDFVDIGGWAHYWNADRGTWCVNEQRDDYWDAQLQHMGDRVTELGHSINEETNRREKADAELKAYVDAYIAENDHTDAYRQDYLEVTDFGKTEQMEGLEDLDEDVRRELVLDALNDWLDGVDFTDDVYLGRCKLKVDGVDLECYHYASDYGEKAGVQLLAGTVKVLEGKRRVEPGTDFGIVVRKRSGDVWSDWESYGGGGSSVEVVQDFGESKTKVLSQAAVPLRMVSTSEYVFAMIDKAGQVVFGIRPDGTPVSGVMERGTQLEFEAVRAEASRLDRKVDELEDLVGTGGSGVSIVQELGDSTSKVLSQAAVPLRMVSTSEYVFAMIDKAGQVVFGIRPDGTPVSGVMERGTQLEFEAVRAEASRLDRKVDELEDLVGTGGSGVSIVQELGDSTSKVLSQAAVPLRMVSTSEYVFAMIDKAGQVVFGIRQDGTPVSGVMELNTRIGLDEVKADAARIETKVTELEDKVSEVEASGGGGTGVAVVQELGDSSVKVLSQAAVPLRMVQTDEYAMAVMTKDGSVLGGFRRDGMPVMNQAEEHARIGIEEAKAQVAGAKAEIDRLETLVAELETKIASIEKSVAQGGGSSGGTSVEVVQELGESTTKVLSQAAVPLRMVQTDEYAMAVMTQDGSVLGGFRRDGMPVMNQAEQHARIGIEEAKAAAEKAQATADEAAAAVAEVKASAGSGSGGASSSDVTALQASLTVMDARLQKTEVKDENGTAQQTPIKVINNDEFSMVWLTTDGYVLMGILRQSGRLYTPGRRD